MGKAKQSCQNWLTLIGPARTITRLTNGGWERALKARHIEWLELSPKHHCCEFTSSGRPLNRLQKLSLRWPTLIFLLEYECGRSMGLVKARRGEMEGCEVHY